MANETFLVIPDDIADPEVLFDILTQIVERLDLILGNTGDSDNFGLITTSGRS